MNILSVRNLKKYYNTGENTVKALDGIDLDICKGEFLAVVGTSGSGKSTLLHMLGGLDNPTSGEIIIDGRNISGLSRDELTVYRRRKIGFVFQNYNLLGHEKIQTTLGTYGHLYPNTNLEVAKKLTGILQVQSATESIANYTSNQHTAIYHRTVEKK